jgi:O-antigen ligase
MGGVPRIGMVEGRARWTDWLHALLLGLTIYAAAHDSATIYVHMPDPAWLGGWLAPGAAIANLLLWLATASGEQRREGLVAIVGIPVLPSIAAALLTLYGLYYSLTVGAPFAWIQPTLSCAATVVLLQALAATRRPIRPLIIGLSAAGVCICAEGLVHLFSRVDDPNKLMIVTGNRWASGDPFFANRLGNGALPYPTLLVSLFLVFASLALGLGGTARTWPGRLLAMAAYALNATCAWLTASRAGIVILVLLTLVHIAVAALGRTRSPQLARFVGVGAAAGCVLFAGIVAKLVLTKGSILRADGSLSSRVKMWRVCWHVFRSRPLVGGGPGAFLAGWRTFIRSWDYPEYSVPHSLYFGILSEGGLSLLAVAAALFVGLVQQTWAVVRSANNTDARLVTAYALGLLAVLAHDLNENSLQMHPMYLLTASFAGIVLGLRRATEIGRL